MTKTFFSCRESMYHYAASSDYEGEYIRSANSSVEGGDVYSYATKVAMFNKDKQTLIYTGERYSNTTTNSLSELCRAFDHFNRWKVYDFTVSDGWNRLVNEYKRNKKHPATRRDDKQYFIDVVDAYYSLTTFFSKGDSKLKTKTFTDAKAMAETYKEQIKVKEEKARARWMEVRRKAEEDRQRRTKLTEDICKEYCPEWGEEPTTFRGCMDNYNIRIPVKWLEEHHQELFDNSNETNIGHLYLSRGWDTDNSDWKNYYEYRRYNCKFKLLRDIPRYGGDYMSEPDVLVYDKETKVLHTNQFCKVDDKDGVVKKLLGLFLQAVDAGKDVSFVIGKHCGPYVIQSYDSDAKFLRVGCHCFLLENLREVYNDMKGV